MGVLCAWGRERIDRGRKEVKSCAVLSGNGVYGAGVVLW